MDCVHEQLKKEKVSNQESHEDRNLVDEEGNVKRGFVLNYDYVTVPLSI